MNVHTVLTECGCRYLRLITQNLLSMRFQSHSRAIVERISARLGMHLDPDAEVLKLVICSKHHHGS